jgi:hypothetical protein
VSVQHAGFLEWFDALEGSCMQEEQVRLEARFAVEMICLDNARRLAQHAKKAQDVWQDSGSLESFLAMQDNALLSTVMSLTALEAFINVQAEERLPKKIWENVFEKLGLKTKWRLLPYILNCEQWEEGEPPFQSFVEMLKFRNDLLHYKPKYEDNMEKFDANRLALESDLTGEKALHWYECAKKMIDKFFELIGESVPQHIREEWFDIRAEVRPIEPNRH